MVYKNKYLICDSRYCIKKTYAYIEYIELTRVESSNN